MDTREKELTVGAHCLSQLERHRLGVQILLVSRLDFDGIRPDDLLDLSALEAHLGLAHNLCLGACYTEQYQYLPFRHAISKEHVMTTHVSKGLWERKEIQ